MNQTQRIEAELQQALSELRSRLHDLSEHAARIAAELEERGESARVPASIIGAGGVAIDVLCGRIAFLRDLKGLAPQ